MIDELMTKVQQRKGGDVEWVGGIESQRNGNPHAHILTDAWIDKDWLQNAWQDCDDGEDWDGFTRIEDVGGDGGGGAAEYACAYVDGGIIGNVP